MPAAMIEPVNLPRPGRPRCEVDLERAACIAAEVATLGELARRLGCSRMTLYRRMVAEPEHAAAIRRSLGGSLA